MRSSSILSTNFVLPDPVGPLIIIVLGCLNFQLIVHVHVMLLASPSLLTVYILVSFDQSK